MSEFKVSVEQFEGPLDLMLHLIKEHELDLFDLNISVLTDQYINYLKMMEQMHLEVASEYLVELATLVEYKSKMLLPKQDSELEDNYEEDPKQRLIRRLLEYQQFKEVTSSLNELYEQRSKQLSKPISMEVDEWIHNSENGPIQGNVYDLAKAMQKCLRRMNLFKPMETKFTAREISMEERSLQIKARLVNLPKTFNFETLLEDCQDQQMVIVTVLSVLDLARLHTLTFVVDENETIWFTKGEA